jgi:hypothetical protein
MFQLAGFSQAHLLQNETDPDLRNGVCVALCDHWLNDIKARTDDAPANRLNRVAGNYPSVAQYQKQYGQQRAQQGPEQARKAMGKQLGHDFQQHTTIVPMLIGPAGIRQRLAADLGKPGVGATWTLRFMDGTGHAIAGYFGMTSKTGNIHTLSLHVFDPNIGEYFGAERDLENMLNDLLNRFPLYQTVIEVRRTTVKR